MFDSFTPYYGYDVPAIWWTLSPWRAEAHCICRIIKWTRLRDIYSESNDGSYGGKRKGSSSSLLARAHLTALPGIKRTETLG